MDLKTFRSQYPQYDSVPDQKLAEAMYKKYYSEMPEKEFYGKIGFTPVNTEETQVAPTEEAPKKGMFERLGNFLTEPLPVSDTDKLIAGSLKKGFNQLAQVPAATELAELSQLQNAQEVEYGKNLENAPADVRATHEETAKRLSQLQQEAALAGVERKQIESEYGVNPLAKKLSDVSQDKK